MGSKVEDPREDPRRVRVCLCAPVSPPPIFACLGAFWALVLMSLLYVFLTSSTFSVCYGMSLDSCTVFRKTFFVVVSKSLQAKNLIRGTHRLLAVREKA